MNRAWTQEELQAASIAMKAAGHMSYEEFCQELKAEAKMEYQINYYGKSRKELAAAIAQLTGKKAIYMKMPTCAFKIGAYTIDKAGTLISEQGIDSVGLLEQLAEIGFVAEGFGTESFERQQGESSKQTNALVISISRSIMNETAMENLDRIISAKGTLLKKAIGADSLAYEIDEEVIRFPWFSFTGDADDATAYTQLVSALAEMARNCKRINSKEKEVKNEKYAFRCFLLRLGMIGDEYKKTRKILLQNLSGNAAYANR